MIRYLPDPLRQSLRRWRHRRAIRAGRFGDLEDPLFQRLGRWVREGDWVIDIGAAVGDYAIPLSALVGARGRVLAFEPTPAQFEILVSNARYAAHPNVTCLQVAVGDKDDVCYMGAPVHDGMKNWYQAAITNADTGVSAVRVALDSLPIHQPIRLMKIDAEGQDLQVLRGAARLMERNPSVIVLVEAAGEAVIAWLEERGFDRHITASNSPNQAHLRSAHHPGFTS